MLRHPPRSTRTATPFPSPPLFRSVAAASPAGPPPTTATSTSAGRVLASVLLGIGDRQLGREVAVGDLGEGAETVKTLAAAHGDPGPALQPGETAGGQRACKRGLDLTQRPQLAVADRAAVSRLRPGARSLLR